MRPGWFRSPAVAAASRARQAWFLLACLLVAAVLTPAPAAPRTLQDVLDQMDKAAAGFRNVVAELTYTKVTLIVDDKSVEKGIVYFQREPGKRDFKIKIEFREPARKTVLFKDSKGWIYRPAIAQVEEYDVGKNKQALEQFLLLGFGSPGHDLPKAYEVTLVGDVKLDGQDTVKLDLTPKSPGVARSIQKVELWLSPLSWQPVQQKFTEPTGDYLLAHYVSPKINGVLSRSEFDAPWRGKKVTVVRPQSG